MENFEKTVRIKAQVLKIENNCAFIRAQNGCGRCFDKGGCGVAKLTQIFCASNKSFPVENLANAQIGDCVEVEIPQKMLNFSATLGYGLPLIAFVLGGILGDYFWGEIGAIGMSFSFLIAVFVVLKIAPLRLKNSVRMVRRL